ncbi:hypothetical protein ABEB36_013190 [Hypothenemus hampei]|uniref:DNA mismatch repair protein S5 domain-containing protein n=1 Tax=Hypothenemus hampei TaxID=57062 RepID=A0ABD1E754_HYPHA
MEPYPIKKLQQDVINRIAAGEVIQRPANALKELMENSLDAKSTNIVITVKNGGLKLLQIQDNGTGIRKDDFEIVCERFTTSKLQEFEDLHKVCTYGFRGEALASISHVAHLTITSKTNKDVCAYQAEYSDGKLKAPPKPLAGNQGTIIAVEDLFYNMNVRRHALRSPAEEYQKISDVVSKYAVHNANVGFTLKKHGCNCDVKTPINSSHKENIRMIYGNSIAQHLVDMNLSNDTLQFKCKGYITSVNYSVKKFQFLLFINNRLVDSQSLRKCIDAVYQTYLPKNGHPFIYLSLDLNPNNVDVNVHPTKHEVHFLNENQIVEIITNTLEGKLLESSSSRIFYTQSKLPNVQFETKETVVGKKTTNEAPKFTVRTDTNIQKLDKFINVSTVKDELPQAANTSITEEEFAKHHEQFLKDQDNFENQCLNITNDSSNKNFKVECVSHKSLKLEERKPSSEEPQETNISNNRPIFQSEFSASQEAKKCEKPLNKHFIKKITRMETKLTSILELRKNIEENCHRTLRETFAQHVFVGAISPKQALIQYNTQLLLCNTKVILEELFYQLILYNFQNFDCYRFNCSMPIKELALMGLDLQETGWTEDDGPKEELATRINEILMKKSPMLNEYFSIEIDSSGSLKSLPILLDNFIPNPLSLPLYLIRLATEVNWETEKECFDSFSRETAMFYSNISEDVDENGKTWQWIMEYILYPAIKEFFIPPKKFTENGAILEVANIPNLYKVFERC